MNPQGANPENGFIIGDLCKQRAAAIRCQNTPQATRLSKAVASLLHYPLPIREGKDCKVLKNFGPSACAAVDKILLLNKVSKGPTIDPIATAAYRAQKLQALDARLVSNSPTQGTQLKMQIDYAEKNGCDVNSWLIKPTSVAKKREVKPRTKAVAKQNTPEALSYEPIDYSNPQLVLLIDKREIKGNRSANPEQLLEGIEKEAKDLCVNFELRTLALGDITWVYRVDEVCSVKELDGTERRTETRTREFILPWIIERKTVRDLEASVIDGRYKEQKSRLLCFGDHTNFITSSAVDDGLDNLSKFEHALCPSNPPPENTVENTATGIAAASVIEIDSESDGSTIEDTSVINVCPAAQRTSIIEDTIAIKLEPLILMLVESCSGDENTRDPIAAAAVSLFSNQWNTSGNRPLNLKMVRSAQIHSQVRDKIKVLQTGSISHTCQYIIKFHRQLQSKLRQILPGGSITLAASSKSRRLSFATWSKLYRAGASETISAFFYKQLRMIPKCTPVICGYIVERWPTPSQFLAQLRMLDHNVLEQAAHQRKSRKKESTPLTPKVL